MIYLRDIDPGYKEGHKYFIIIKGELVDITNERLENRSGELFYDGFPIEQILRAERELNRDLPITGENNGQFENAWYYSNKGHIRNEENKFWVINNFHSYDNKLELTNGWWYWKDTLLYCNSESIWHAKAFSGELVYESKPAEMIKTVLLDEEVVYEGSEHEVNNWLVVNVGQSQYYNKKFTVTQKTQKKVCSSLHL